MSGSASAPEPREDFGPAVRWDALPEAVRNRLAQLASGALDALPESDVPLSVRRLSSFAPAKRARLGGGRLLAALRDSPSFRAAVLAWSNGQLADQRPGEPTAEPLADPAPPAHA